MQYLKDKQHYEDLYDLHTIESCLLTIDSTKSVIEKKTKIGKRDLKISVDGMTNFILYFKKGERYKTKNETIEKWMDRDRKLDETLSNAVFPSYIDCEHCHGQLSEESRHLDSILGTKPRVQFFAICKSCERVAMVWDDGERYIPKPSLCPKCHLELKTTSKYTEEKDTITEKCPKCDYKNIQVYDFKKSQEERDAEKAKDSELLVKYRSEFCISDKEGSEYVTQMENMTRLSEMMKESEAKQKDPDYQKARSVKKVTVTELHKILTKKFKADGFINLNFENPQIDRYVIVPFTVQDEKKSRKKDKSIKDLRRIFNFTLDNLNWRLMSDGIEYRMGYLKGRLKGYENDDELAKFNKKKDNKRPLFWDKDGPVY